MRSTQYQMKSASTRGIKSKSLRQWWLQLGTAKVSCMKESRDGGHLLMVGSCEKVRDGVAVYTRHSLRLRAG